MFISNDKFSVTLPVIEKENFLCVSDIFSGESRISRRGGVDLVGGAVDPRGGYVSKILHVKMKESGPVGGACPPRSANDIILFM